MYYVIVAYREKGRSDIAIKLMDKLLEYLNSSKVNCEARMEEIAVLYIERKNLLTDMEMYDEAIKNVYEYMKICFKLDRGDKIVPLLIEPRGGFVMRVTIRKLWKCLTKSTAKNIFNMLFV